MNTWRNYPNHEIDDSKELEADFNCPKIHLMSDWVKQICRYGALQQYSAERHEQTNKTKFKAGWNTSNHNLNYLLQVVTFQCQNLSFEIRELYLQALAQHRDYHAAICNALPPGDYLAAALSSQSYAMPDFMGPQNWPDGKHCDAMTKDI